MTKCKKEKTTAENQQVSEENVAPNAAENVESVFTLTQAAYESGVFFSDNFDWVSELAV